MERLRQAIGISTALALLAALPGPARAAEAPSDEPHAAFALIIGVNSSPNPDLQPLKYADDDAARYFDLFAALGARTYLLAGFDDNTARLHPEAREASYPADMESLRVVAGQMALDIERARRNGRVPVAYVVYAGHGRRHGGHAHLTLEGSELPSAVLYREVLAKLHAEQTHLIIDACYAELLVSGRGPGGERFAVDGFSEESGLDRDPTIGLLIATSTSAESHEWERVQAGVFSHEVRSGLYGAADVDRDGQVSYREIAAFVERANSAVPNERFRPQILARPPIASETLLVTNGNGSRRRLEIDGATHHGHYVVEDARGVRLLELNNAAGSSVAVRLPESAGDVFVREADSETEYHVPVAASAVMFDQLEGVVAGETRPRGARHEAFELLFSAPLAAEDVATVRLTPPPPLGGPPFPVYSVAKWSVAGGAAALLLAGGFFTYRAVDARDRAAVTTSQLEAASLAAEVDEHNRYAFVSYAGSAALTGLAAWLFLSEE